MSPAESQFDAKLDVTGNYIGQGICNKEVEVPLWVNCRLSYLNITNSVRVPPLVQWSYKGLKSAEFIKLSVDTALTICRPEDMHTFLCKYRRKHTCTPDFDGWYKCDIAVETTDGREGVFSDDVIICESILSYFILIWLFLLVTVQFQLVQFVVLLLQLTKDSMSRILENASSLK